jgi:hypothetical protein
MNTMTKSRPATALCVVTGGQTGVDRAALDVALALGLSHGGWCPRGRRAEDGPIDERYALRETESDRYHIRTERNVEDADATLILTLGGPLTGGTRLTQTYARRHGKPCRVVALGDETDPAAVRAWLAELDVRILNIAGPRESTQPGVYAAAADWLRRLWRGAES